MGRGRGKAAPKGFVATVRATARALIGAKVVPAPLMGIANVLAAFGGYDSAKVSRLRPDWTTTSGGPNSTVAAASTNLVARSRDLDRNDPHWRRYLTISADEGVGTGIVPRAMGAPTEFGAPKARTRTLAQHQADAAWSWFAGLGRADVEGRATIYAVMWLAWYAWERDGAVFFRRVWDMEPGRVVPFRVQALERDMLDTSRHGATDSGGQIIGGIQVSALGRVEGYWFLPSHPGETSLLSRAGASVFVAACDVIHLVSPLRVGQLDGVPHGSAAMVRKQALSSYAAAELVRKEIETRSAVIVTAPAIAEALSPLEEDDDHNPYGLTPSVLDENGNAVGDIRPGSVLCVENGGSVTHVQPQATAYYPEYMAQGHHEVAAGLNIPYEDLTGDLSGVNYTSYRAGHLKRDAHVDVQQWIWFIPTLCDRLWDWCQEGAYLAGNASTPNMPREWSTPKRMSVDAEKDAIADIIQERAGYILHDTVLASRGEDPATFYERRQAELDAAGELVFDSNPSKMAFRGAFPPAVSGTNVPVDPAAEPALEPDPNAP
jgi:lambda family phage portal protein